MLAPTGSEVRPRVTLGLLLGGGAEVMEVSLPDGGRRLLLRAGGEQALFERRPQP